MNTLAKSELNCVTNCQRRSDVKTSLGRVPEQGYAKGPWRYMAMMSRLYGKYATGPFGLSEKIISQLSGS